MDDTRLELMKSLFRDCTMLLTSRPEFAFAGMIYYSMKRILCDSEDYKKLNPHFAKCSLAYTDGKQIVYLIDDNTNRGKFIFVTLHEIVHVASDHLVRLGERKPKIWNLAADHITNGVCKAYAKAFPNSIEVPDGIFHLDDLPLTFESSNVEEVYEYLLNEQQNGKLGITTIKIRVNGPPGSGQPEDEEDEDDGSETIDVDIVEYNGKKYMVANDTDLEKIAKNISKNTGQDTSDVMDELKDLLGELQDNIKNNWYTMKQAGTLPGNIVAYIDKIFEVKIPWYTILEDAILYPVQCYNRKTWHIVNPVFRGTPLYKRKDKSKYSYRAKGKHPKDLFPHALLFCMDSSASISDDDIAKGINVISQAYGKYQDIIVLIHDKIVQDEIYFLNIQSKDDILDNFKKNGVKGRGGTSHLDLFNRIESLSEDYDISTIIFLTDYYSDIDSIYDKYRFIKENETIWLIVDNSKLKEVTLNECKTRTIHI